MTTSAIQMENVTRRFGSVSDGLLAVDSINLTLEAWAEMGYQTLWRF